MYEHDYVRYCRRKPGNMVKLHSNPNSVFVIYDETFFFSFDFTFTLEATVSNAIGLSLTLHVYCCIRCGASLVSVLYSMWGVPYGFMPMVTNCWMHFFLRSVVQLLDMLLLISLAVCLIFYNYYACTVRIKYEPIKALCFPTCPGAYWYPACCSLSSCSKSAFKHKWPKEGNKNSFSHSRWENTHWIKGI